MQGFHQPFVKPLSLLRLLLTTQEGVIYRGNMSLSLANDELDLALESALQVIETVSEGCYTEDYMKDKMD